MKKIMLLAFISIVVSLKAQEVMPKEPIKKELLNPLTATGIDLHQAGKLKNWALFTGLAAGILATQMVKNDGTTNKPILFISLGGGLTALILEITANSKISRAGKRLKKLDRIQ